MKPGFGPRVLTAAILIPLVVAAIWWGPNWLVAVVSAAVAIAAMREYFSIAAHLGYQSYKLWTYLAAAGIFAQQWYAPRQRHSPGRLARSLAESHRGGRPLRFRAGCGGHCFGKPALHQRSVFLHFRERRRAGVYRSPVQRRRAHSRR